MITAFPDLAFGPSFKFYFKVQFPVGILGALFDSLSFFITLKIIRKALRSNKLAVFSFSGWIISLTETNVEILSHRNEIYRERVISALEKPNDNLRNIYFGIIMGISAMIPTIFNLFSGLRAFIFVMKNKKD